MKIPFTTEARTKLDAALHFLKRQNRISLQNLAMLGDIPDSNGGMKKIHASYFSNARQNEIDPEYKALFNLITSTFSLCIDKNEQDLFQITIENEKRYIESVTLITQGNELTSSDNGTGIETETMKRKLKEFSSTWWSLYFWTNTGIGKAILNLDSNKRAFIRNTPNNEGLVKDYVGQFYFDVNLMYLSLSMKDAHTGEKDLQIKMSVGRGSKPSLCLGQYQNIGDRGGEIYSATCIFVLEKDDAESLIPILFPKNDAEKFEIVSPWIRKYFQDKALNHISTPSSNIRTEKSLKNWLMRKQEERKLQKQDLKLRAYLNKYYLFVGGDEMDKYELNIYPEGPSINATLQLIEAEEEHTTDVWKEGKVTRYESTLFIVFENNGKQMFLQIGIGEEQTALYECYGGIISGLYYTGKKLAAYRTLIVRKEFIDNGEDKLPKLKKIIDNLRGTDNNRILTSSPEEFKIANLG